MNHGRADEYVAVGFVTASGIISNMFDFVAGPFFLTTMLPAIAGTLLYTRRKARQAKRQSREALELFDLVNAAGVSLAIGVLFGPWFASISPETEKAVAPLCFACAYWPTEFINALKRKFFQ